MRWPPTTPPPAPTPATRRSDRRPQNTPPADPSEANIQLAAVRRILEVLNVIQDHAGTVIRVPDFPKVDPTQFQAWRVAAAMLQGRELTATIPEGHALTIDLDSEIEVEDSVAVSMPWTVTIDDQVIDLGRYEVLLEEPVLVHRGPVEGGFSHTFTTKDNRIKQRRGSATT